MLRTLLLTIGISSRIRKPINEKRHPNERVPKGGKKEREKTRLNFVRICFDFFVVRGKISKGRKEGRKFSRDPSVFQLNFHATKGWRTVVEKRKIDCSRMWPVLSNRNSECLGCFFFPRGKAVMEFRRSPPLFCRFISRWERRQRHRGGGRGGEETVLHDTQHLQFCYSRWLNISFFSSLSF